MKGLWRDLDAALAGSQLAPWSAELMARAEQRFAESRHGDLPGWEKAVASLPATAPKFEPGRAAPRLGARTAHPQALRKTLMQLRPWRKGPLELGGVHIDAEWRSDLKWQRLEPHLDVRGHQVLDIGCGNGYFGWRMLAAGARSIVGIDPTLLYVMQWRAQRHFAPDTPNFVLPLADTDLPVGLSGFDTVFSMGVLYHRREPDDHLRILRRSLAPGGQLILETLVIDQPGHHRLVPDGRYARMRNVWSVPGPDLMCDTLAGAGFTDIRLLDISVTSTAEQRSTDWMPFESLAQSLDPADPGCTVEGHPAPARALFMARVA